MSKDYCKMSRFSRELIYNQSSNLKLTNDFFSLTSIDKTDENKSAKLDFLKSIMPTKKIFLQAKRKQKKIIKSSII
jgi:hypothetical protein